MANEISIQASLTQNANSVLINASVSSVLSLGTGQVGAYSNTQSIGTGAAEAITVPADDDISYLLIKNLDGTNKVTVGWTNPPTEIEIQAGEFAMFRPADPSAPVIYAKATGSAVDIQVVAAGSTAAA
jgi:hypothetical protein